jgi:hypothetical protein
MYVEHLSIVRCGSTLPRASLSKEMLRAKKNELNGFETRGKLGGITTDAVYENQIALLLLFRWL